MNKISEYPAQIYMQSENRKKIIESIFNLKKTKQIYTSYPYMNWKVNKVS